MTIVEVAIVAYCLISGPWLLWCNIRDRRIQRGWDDRWGAITDIMEQHGPPYLHDDRPPALPVTDRPITYHDILANGFRRPRTPQPKDTRDGKLPPRKELH